MRLIFEVPGRPRDDLVLGEGERTDGGSPIVAGGESFEVADDRARQLLADLYPSVREAPVAEHDLAAMTRAQLNDHAAGAGIEQPEKLTSKQAVIDALAETGAVGREGDEDKPGTLNNPIVTVLDPAKGHPSLDPAA